MAEPVRLIHISVGGPDRYMRLGMSILCFEQHPYFGPFVLGKRGEPLANQPGERDPFWQHWHAWNTQGQQVVERDGKDWCVYTLNGKDYGA